MTADQITSAQRALIGLFIVALSASSAAAAAEPSSMIHLQCRFDLDDPPVDRSLTIDENNHTIKFGLEGDTVEATIGPSSIVARLEIVPGLFHTLTIDRATWTVSIGDKDIGTYARGTCVPDSDIARHK